VIDVIRVVTDSANPNNYRTQLKKREPQLVTNCHRLKLASADGKKYLTDVVHREAIVRILLSVPSPKVEPFKQWLSSVAVREMDEIANPELKLERLEAVYRAKGYPEEWITTRLRSIVSSKQLTDEWKNRGVTEGGEYAQLTAEIAKATFGLSPTEHKQLKTLNKQNLHDHMTNMELILPCSAKKRRGNLQSPMMHKVL
jgi:DNA-damage-inducible protein D